MFKPGDLVTFVKRNGPYSHDLIELETTDKDEEGIFYRGHSVLYRHYYHVLAQEEIKIPSVEEISLAIAKRITL